jgi:phosphoribosyl 1,2-cyclic phosphate phosphodiesterase
MADLERVFEFAFKALNPFPGYLKPEPHIVCGAFQLGLTTITPLPVPHGQYEVNGYMFARDGIKLVAYLCDCSAVPDQITQKIEGVKILIIDALRPKPHPTHLSVQQALDVAARVRPSETYFTHIAHELPQAAEAELPPHAHIAYDGLKLEL